MSRAKPVVTAITAVNHPVSRLFAFAKERHAIYDKWRLDAPRPWTQDQILSSYRFCNVYRELDAVTQWITKNWRTPNMDDKDLWFAMCVARLFNQPDCLQDVGYPVPWKPDATLKKLGERQKKGFLVFNAAYIVSTNGIATSKTKYVVNDVLTPLWQARERLRPKPEDTLNSYHMLLGQMQGFGSFMTAQVIADMKYVAPLKDAKDWWTFAASGPGSRRGLNYVLGRERKSPWTEDEWRSELHRLQCEIAPMFKNARMPPPHAQDIQNLLCEWSKYWRAVTEGKMPKQRYRA